VCRFAILVHGRFRNERDRCGSKITVAAAIFSRPEMPVKATADAIAVESVGAAARSIGPECPAARYVRSQTKCETNETGKAIHLAGQGLTQPR
jgi:hypothetical protein